MDDDTDPIALSQFSSTLDFSNLISISQSPNIAAQSETVAENITLDSASASTKLNMSLLQANSSVAKRRPGRPPSKKQDGGSFRQGIVDKPLVETHRLEYITESPSIFKKIFMYLKEQKAELLYFRFGRDGFDIFTKSHNNRAKLMIHIDGKLANRYYCLPNNKIILVERAHIQHIFQQLSMQIVRLSIAQESLETDQLKFYVTNNTGSRSCFTEEVSEQPMDVLMSDLISMENYLIREMINQNFELSFDLDCSSFKLTLQQSKTLTNMIIIDKSPVMPSVIIQYSTSSSSSLHPCGLNVDCRDKDGIVHVKIGLDYIIPLIKSFIGSYITFHLKSQGENLFITSSDDNSIKIISLINTDIM